MPRRRHHPAYDPLAPLGPKAQKKAAYALLAPLIAQINAEFDRRASSGASSIRSHTDRLAQDLAPLRGQTHATYAAAEAQQRADDAALANRLSGAGTELAGQVAGTPGVDSGTGDIAGIGRGASNAGFATGSSRLAALLAHGAAAEAYSGQMPGFARLGGAQRLSNLTGQLESQRGSQLSEARSKIPALAQQIRDTELQKAIAVQSGLASSARLAETSGYHQASLGLRQQQQQTDALFKQAGLDLRGAQYKLAVRRENRLQKGKKGGEGGFTPSQISKLRGTAILTVQDWKHGVAPTYATGHEGDPQYIKDPGHSPRTGPRGGPRGAFRFLILHGIPPSMADWAVGQVYGKWKSPGEHSRRGRGGTGPR